VTGLMIVVALLFAPVVPMNDMNRNLVTISPAVSEGTTSAAEQADSSLSACHSPSGAPGCLVISDPSGAYYLKDIGNNTWEMLLSTYDALLQDPYTAICNESVSVVNDTAYLTCPPSPISEGVSGGVSNYPVFSSNNSSPSSGLGSASYAVFRLGGLYSNGQYRFVL